MVMAQPQPDVAVFSAVSLVHSNELTANVEVDVPSVRQAHLNAPDSDAQASSYIVAPSSHDQPMSHAIALPLGTSAVQVDPLDDSLHAKSTREKSEKSRAA